MIWDKSKAMATFLILLEIGTVGISGFYLEGYLNSLICKAFRAIRSYFLYKLVGQTPSEATLPGCLVIQVNGNLWTTYVFVAGFEAGRCTPAANYTFIAQAFLPVVCLISTARVCKGDLLDLILCVT